MVKILYHDPMARRCNRNSVNIFFLFRFLSRSHISHEFPLKFKFNMNFHPSLARRSSAEYNRELFDESLIFSLSIFKSGLLSACWFASRCSGYVSNFSVFFFIPLFFLSEKRNSRVVKSTQLKLNEIENFSNIPST